MEQKKDHTWFWVFTGLIATLLIIFIAQNNQAVRIKFLMINIEGPGFLVFLVVFLIGFLAGVGWGSLRRARKESKILREKNSYNQREKDIHHQGH